MFLTLRPVSHGRMTPSPPGDGEGRRGGGGEGGRSAEHSRAFGTDEHVFEVGGP